MIQWRLLPLLASSLVISDFCPGQDFWLQTNGPFGGFVNALAADTTGTIFAGTLDAGVFRSNDNGATWTEANFGLTNFDVRSLLIGPTGTMVAGVDYDVNGGIFRSMDGGQTWSQVFGSLQNTLVSALAVDTSGSFTMDSTGVLFAGTDNSRVFRSTNNGANWAPVNNGLPPVPVITLVANATANGRVLAGTQGGGAYFSLDHGDNWVPALLPRFQVFCLALDRFGQELAGTDSGVFSYDGISWLGPTLAGRSVRSLVVAGDTIFAGTDYTGIWRSTDNGVNWFEVNPNVVDASIPALVINSAGFVFAGANGRGIFASGDGGNTWQRVSDGLRNAFVTALGIDVVGNVLAATDGEWISRSTNGGADWARLNPGFDFINVASLVTTPGGLTFAGTSSGNGVFLSSNNGQTWIPFNDGLTAGDVISLAVNPFGDVFAGTAYGGIFRLVTGSTTWTQVDNLVTNARVPSVAVDQGGTIFAAIDSGGVYRSADNGNSWTFVNNGLTNFFVTSVAVSPTTWTVFATTFGGGTHRSTDAGDTWVVADGSPNNDVFTVEAGAGGAVFVASGTGAIRRSPDDGISWFSVESGIRGHFVYSFAFDPNGFLYAGSSGGGVYRSVESTLPPAVPTLLNPTSGSVNQPTTVPLQWSRSQIATSYYLQLGTDPSFTTGLVVDDPTLADTFFVVTGLSNVTTYYWRVSASNSNGSSGFSASDSFTTVIAPPATPVPVSPGNGATNQPATLRLFWAPSITAASYHLQVAIDSLFANLIVDDSTLIDTSGQVGPLANNMTYFWHVRSTNLGGSSLFSAAPRFSTAASVSIGDTVAFPPAPSSSTDYRLFSVPGVSPLTVGNILTGSQGTDWRIFRDNGAPSNYLVELGTSSPLTTGKGYWVVKKGHLNVSRTLTMPSLASDGTYAISLDSGWNIIGNPFNTDVPWANVIAANGISPTSQLISYQGLYNYTAGVMKPFRGYYFFNPPAAFLSTLRIPFPFGTAVVPSTSAPFTWRVELVLESSINMDRGNFIGIAPSAQTGEDALDARKAPLIFDQGFLYFPRPSWDTKYTRFRSDFRPVLGEGQVWEFETSNPRKGGARIRIEGTGQVPAQYEVRLVNMHNSTPVDLRRSSVYAYQSVNETTPFRIMIGTSAFVARELESLVPTTFELSQNFPNPFNPSTAITFKLPRDSRVRLDVVSLLGQHVGTLADGVFPAAVHTVVWDGTSRNGARVASGVYFCRLFADGSLVHTRKMVLAK